jgi:tungstate transport system substrate-binding protein
MADERRAYVLTDRGTYLSVRKSKNLAVLVEGDKRLANPYGVILVNPEKHPDIHIEAAKKLRDFFVSPEGQEKIGAFRMDGEVLFHPAAGGN